MVEMAQAINTLDLQTSFLQSKLSQGRKVSVSVSGVDREVEVRNNNIFISNAPLDTDLSYHRYVVRSALDKVNLTPVGGQGYKVPLAVA